MVIPAWNAASTLGSQLEALSLQTFAGKWEVVIADNGSTDGTGDVARGWASRIPVLRVVDASARQGSGYARNFGAASAEGELILYCDSDDVVSPVWVEEMTKTAVGGDLIAGSQNTELLNDSVAMPWQPAPRTWIPGAGTEVFLPFAPGSNFGIWKNVLEQLGGWDESYVYAGDDLEICWRAQLQSFELVIAENALVHYRHRTSLRSFASQRYKWARANPKLFAQFRDKGMQRPSLKVAGRRWASLVYRLPWALFSPRWRAEWVYRAAVASGYLVGSLKSRVIFL
ncbi:MAG TPA: glycosyltransferase family 2 protein [Actinomycetota bacterium]|nr:glycosyltransferase family 2 protein [Actinomycetota bacterium]